MLKLSNVRKSYYIGKREEEILKGISLEILDGQFNMIIGPSGSGKSTLLNIISGIDKKFSGEIYYDNKDYRELDIDDYRSQNIGFVFQNFNLIEHISVEENIKICMYLKSNYSKSDEKKVDLILKKLGIYEQKYKLPSQLSGGQKQRVAIARAIINDSKIIIADEPTGALDSNTSLEIMKILRNLCDEGKTIIMVTHDESLLKYADKVIKIKDGKIEDLKILNDSRKLVPVEEQSSVKNGLSIRSIFKTVWNNIKTRKIRNLIVSMSTAIGVMAVLLGLSFGTGVENKMKNLFETVESQEAVIISAKTDSDQQGFNFNRALTNEEMSQIKSMMDSESIYDSCKVIMLNYSSIEYDGKEINKRQLGAITEFDVPVKREAMYNSNDGLLLAGNVVSNNECEALIPETIAKQMLNIEENEELTSEKCNEIINDELTIKKRDLVNGEVKEKEYNVKIVGVIKTDSGLADMKLVPVYLSHAAMDKAVSELEETKEVYGYTYYTHSPEESDKIVEKFSKDEKFTFSNIASVSKSISKSVKLIKASVTFIASISLIIAAVLIAIVLFNGVLERIKEIGIMRAIGYKRKNIIQIFLYESIFIVLLSNVIALGLSFMLVGALNEQLRQMTAYTNIVVINWVSIVEVLLFSEVIAVIAALYPSVKAANVDPIEVLR